MCPAGSGGQEVRFPHCFASGLLSNEMIVPASARPTTPRKVIPTRKPRRAAGIGSHGPREVQVDEVDHQAEHRQDGLRARRHEQDGVSVILEKGDARDQEVKSDGRHERRPRN